MIKKNITGFKNIAERCVDWMVWRSTEARANQCDILIDIEGVEAFGFFSFQESEAIIELGYQATLKRIPQIKARIEALK